MPVKLTCGEEVVEGRTDDKGSFRLRCKAVGKCRFQITWKDRTAAIDVIVFERATRYRFVVEEADGKLNLKRV